MEILKALYRNVSLLISDEPTGVLNPQETESFFGVLKRLKAEGYGIIIITHRLSEIMAISDRVTILRDGRAIKELVTGDTTPEELSAHMIGRPLSVKKEERKRPSGENALILNGLTLSKKHGGKKALDHVELTVKKGEILGIAGVEGNGQKELCEVITGIRKCPEGTITFFGETISGLSVRERFYKGISYISDDRHIDSLVMDMTVTDNLILRDFRRPPYSKGLAPDYKKAEEPGKERDFSLCGMAGGLLVNMIHGVLSIRLSKDQSVNGIAINIFVPGVTSFLYKLMSNGQSYQQIEPMPYRSDSRPLEFPYQPRHCPCFFM